MIMHICCVPRMREHLFLWEDTHESWLLVLTRPRDPWQVTRPMGSSWALIQ